jgi:hypothetical protein
MIITRTRPNNHQVEGFVFHPGAQFVPDEFYAKKLANSKRFKAQLKHKLMEITVPPAELPKNAKAGDKAEPKKSLADTIATLPEDEAIAIIGQAVDGADLKEIIRTDKRRPVVDAAEKQMVDRQGTLDAMAPKMPKSHPGDIKVSDKDFE